MMYNLKRFLFNVGIGIDVRQVKQKILRILCKHLTNKLVVMQDAHVIVYLFCLFACFKPCIKRDGLSKVGLISAFIQRLVGEAVVSSISLNDLHNNFALAPLVGKILNFSMDLNADYLNGRAVSAIKMLTGGDLITINEKYQPMFAYRNMAKFVFATNSPVLLKKPDDAFWEQMVIVPFLHSVDKEEQDKELPDKLWEERTGIVAKAMKAARKLIQNNYIFPACHIADSMKLSWAKNDVAFVWQCCDLRDTSTRTYTHQLYRRYIQNCEDHDLEVESENLFSRVLGSRFGLKRSRWSEDGCTAQRGFLGIQLLP